MVKKDPVALGTLNEQPSVLHSGTGASHPDDYYFLLERVETEGFGGGPGGGVADDDYWHALLDKILEWGREESGKESQSSRKHIAGVCVEESGLHSDFQRFARGRRLDHNEPGESPFLREESGGGAKRLCLAFHAIQWWPHTLQDKPHQALAFIGRAENELTRTPFEQELLDEGAFSHCEPSNTLCPVVVSTRYEVVGMAVVEKTPRPDSAPIQGREPFLEISLLRSAATTPDVPTLLLTGVAEKLGQLAKDQGKVGGAVGVFYDGNKLWGKGGETSAHPHLFVKDSDSNKMFHLFHPTRSV